MYQVAALIHVFAAIVWVGGMLFFAVALIPVTRSLDKPPGAGAAVLGAVAQRFRVVGWTTLGVLVGSGIWLLAERGVTFSDVLKGGGAFYDTLRVKLVLVGLMLVLSGIHDFVLGPRMARRLVEAQGAQTAIALRRARRQVSWLARLTALLAVSIVVAGVFLVRGLP